MADFQNLTGEVYSAQNNQDSEEEGEAYNDEATLHQRAQAGQEEFDDAGHDQQQIMEIPAALLEAEAQQRDEQERDTSNLSQDLDETVEGQLVPDEDYEALKRLWIQEVNSTELLDYDSELIPILMEMIPSQEEVIEQFQAQALQNPSAVPGSVDPNLASLAASICKMDLDRMYFLLADLKRTRLGKIEKYALHNREILDRMSEKEVNYLKEYGELFESHMRRSVLDYIPKDLWKKLDEPEMIDRPNIDNYVFCEVVHEEGVVINNHKGLEIDEEEETEPERHYDAGSFLFARYAVIRDLVFEGKIELLM